MDSVLEVPGLSMPAGLTVSGLPAGLQITGLPGNLQSKYVISKPESKSPTLKLNPKS